MESNTNPAWEPEEKNISSRPADEQQTEDIDYTETEEEILPEDDEIEDESLEDDEVEDGNLENDEIEEPVEEGSADLELDTEEESPDTAHNTPLAGKVVEKHTLYE